MVKRVSRRNTALLLLALLQLLALPASRVDALGLDALTFEGGLHLLVNAEADSAPSPLPAGGGLSLRWTRPGRFELESGLQLFGTWYEYAGGRARPAEPEQRQFLLLAALADLRAGAVWPLNRRFSVGTAAGLGLLARLPVRLGDGFPTDLAPALDYLYGQGRFLLPETELSTRWQAGERWELRTSLRVFWPLFHLWDGEGLPFADQMVVSGLIGLRYTPTAAP